MDSEPISCACVVLLHSPLLQHVTSFMRGPAQKLVAVDNECGHLPYASCGLPAHMVRNCKLVHFALMDNTDNFAILRMLAEYLNNPGGKRSRTLGTLGEEAQYSAFYVGDMPATMAY